MNNSWVDLQKHYLDAWGDLWKLVKMNDGSLRVIRLKDGNIGGWQDGDGLKYVKWHKQPAPRKDKDE